MLRNRGKEPFESSEELHSVYMDNFRIDFDNLDINNEKHLGKGMTGAVYEAKWSGIDVAVKEVFFSEELENYSNERREEILGEAERMVMMRHPNIAEFYGISTHGKQVCIVMKRYECSLREWIVKEGKASSLEDKLRISLGISRALNYLHSKHVGIVHRDFRPNNILICKEHVRGRTVVNARVCDFGISRALGHGTTDLIIGRPHYLAPELMKQKRGHVVPEADIYSLGVTLWAIFSDSLPEIQNLAIEPLFPDSILVYEKDVVREVMAIAKQCCAHEPQERTKIEVVVKRLEKLLKCEEEKNAPARKVKDDEARKVEEMVKELKKREMMLEARDSEIEKLKSECRRVNDLLIERDREAGFLKQTLAGVWNDTQEEDEKEEEEKETEEDEYPDSEEEDDCLKEAKEKLNPDSLCMRIGREVLSLHSKNNNVYKVAQYGHEKTWQEMLIEAAIRKRGLKESL